MKRTIEFRANEYGGGKHLYGFVWQTESGAWFIRSAKTKETARVNPSTIAQYINIDDPSGARVYEGDSVELTGKARRRIVTQVDWQGFVRFPSDGTMAHLDDLAALGYKWRLNPSDK